MLKIGIAVDDYKIPAFKRGIKEAGYIYDIGPGVTNTTKFIYVYCSKRQLPELTKLIRELNLSSTKSNMN